MHRAQLRLRADSSFPSIKNPTRTSPERKLVEEEGNQSQRGGEGGGECIRDGEGEIIECDELQGLMGDKLADTTSWRIRR